MQWRGLTPESGASFDAPDSGLAPMFPPTQVETARMPERGRHVHSDRHNMSAACPVFGFVVEFSFATPLDDEQIQSLRRALRGEILEPRGLNCVDRFDGRRWLFTVRSEASQATHADRQALEAWAEDRPEIATTRVGPLVDLASAA